MLRRLGQSLVVLAGVSVLAFSLIHLVEGDPIRQALGTRFSQEAYDALEKRNGLDLPVVQQYFRWLGHALTGDLGVSFRSGQPVTAIIAERLPATLTLAFSSILLALLIAVPLGTISALRPRSVIDRLATVFSQFGISVPDFWMAIMLILVFAGTLGWLPTGGYVSPFESFGGWLQRLILPTVVTGLVSGSVITRFVRSSVLEALGQDHVRTAHAKGLPPREVLNWHVLRNALLPLVTVTGVQLAYLLSGVVVVEIVFSWPGLGQLAIQAVDERNYPVLQGTVLLFALVFLLINLVVDLLYTRIDPRISRR
ncbi:MAG TPA: ABC transporter permease [Pseudonocardiaceae bacterium]|nr:ABC transporter permease [Pseudonocardiaceae bacterium]